MTAAVLAVSQPPDRLTVIRSAIIDARGLARIPAPEPLVSGVLFRDSLCWLFGAPACGKSFVALDVAGCVGTGEPWQGHPVQRGVVLYVIAEGASGVYQRVQAWESAMGREMDNVLFLPLAIQAADAADWRAFVEAAAELRPVLVVIDTQARCTVGLEENSALDMGRFVHRVEQLRAATRACVLVVHHAGRMGEHLRGSVALDGAANTVIKIKRTDDVLELACAKQKDASEFEALILRLVPYEASAVIAPSAVATRAPISAPVARRTVALWWESFATDWVTVKQLSETIGIDRGSIYRYMKAQINVGLVEKKGEANFARYRLTREPASQLSQSCNTPVADVPVSVSQPSQQLFRAVTACDRHTDGSNNSDCSAQRCG